MKFTIPLAALAAIAVYSQAGAQETSTMVLLGAIGFYLVVNFALLRD